MPLLLQSGELARCRCGVILLQYFPPLHLPGTHAPLLSNTLCSMYPMHIIINEYLVASSDWRIFCQTLPSMWRDDTIVFYRGGWTVPFEYGFWCPSTWWVIRDFFLTYRPSFLSLSDLLSYPKIHQIISFSTPMAIGWKTIPSRRDIPVGIASWHYV